MLTIALYVYIFVAPIFLAEKAFELLNSVYIEDRAKEFCVDCGDGISLTDYLVINKVAAEMGFTLEVNVTMPGYFYTDDELHTLLETKDLEIVPETLVEVYLENDKFFIYESEIYIVKSGGL
jgi:hypothetical protein